MNHVVPTELMEADIIKAITATAPKPAMVSSLIRTKLEVIAEGEDLFITPLGTDIMSQVVITDVKTCVGTMHVIDAVLVPAGPEPASAPIASGTYGDRLAGGY